MTPEGAVKKKVRAILDELGCYYFMPAGSAYGHAGVPDFVGCIHGQFFALECKAGKGKTTALQDRELQKIGDAGGVAMIINETHIEEIMSCLKKF